jgi:dTDP-4-dehydrorhamnose reductase
MQRAYYSKVKILRKRLLLNLQTVLIATSTTMLNIKTILVTGSSGQLGQSLKAIANNYPDLMFTFATRTDLDLSNEHAIDAYFQQHHFDLIINCAAYTAVDKAEPEPELAGQINHLAVKQLAEIAKHQTHSHFHRLCI